VTHAFRLTDGINTISLVDEGVLLTNYTPEAPQGGASSVTDTIEIYAHDKTKAALVEKVRAIEAMLGIAHRRNLDTVFLEARIDGESTWWRSPIYSGRVQLDKETLREWANIKAQAALHIERAPYFEGAETQLQISGNAQAARPTLQLSSGIANWIGVTGAQITGSMPAAVRLRLTNRAGAAVAYRNFYLSVNAFNFPNAFNYLVATNQAATWTAGASHTGTAGKWKVKLTQAQITAAGGDSFHLLAVFGPITPRAYIRGHVGNYDYHDASGPEIYTGELFGDELVDLGTFNIPPTRGSANNEINATITVRSQSAGFGTLKYIYLMPAETFRHWRQDSFSNVDGVFIEEDAALGAIYRGNADARYGGLQAFGHPLALWPGRDQRIYVAFSEASGNFVDGRRVDAQLWIRPRRATV
jgi:hypothetical protein